MASRAAVFGDVHGKASLLKKLIKKLRKKYGPDIEFFSAGDLIDRGGEEKEVIETCIYEGVAAVAGNHDHFIIDLISKQYFPPSYIDVMSGTTTLSSYGVPWNEILMRHIKGESYTDKIAEIGATLLKNMPESHKAYFLNMEPYIKIDWLDDKTYWIFHAGLQQSTADKYQNQSKDDSDLVERAAKGSHDMLIWGFPKFVGSSDNLYHFNNGVQIFGHRYTAVPIVKDHFVALDTIGGGQSPLWTLSCVVLPDMEIVQVTEDEESWI